MDNRLDNIFKPKSIAVIGASNTTGSVGYVIFNNLLTGGFNGDLYPVNRKHEIVQEQKAYKSISDVPVTVDLAVIVTPSRAVPIIVKECGEKGIKGMVIISAGFKEAGEEGKKMYDQIIAYGEEYGICIIGPNCLGVQVPSLNMNATFGARLALPGNIAFISQSGALCTAILDWSIDQTVGFSHFVSLGSMADIGFDDLLRYFGEDPSVSSILIYMESLSHSEAFMEAAQRYGESKPIIVLKAGKSAGGAKAAASHTGSLAGNNAAFNAAFEKAGIISVETIAQLFNCAQALAMQPLPKGNRLGIVTNGGGPAVLATDYLLANGGKLAEFREKTIAEMNTYLSPVWSHGNPADVLGDASPEAYRRALEDVLNDPWVDAVLAIVAPVAVADPTDTAKALEGIEKVNKNNKPILACWLGETDVREGRELLETYSIPNYRYPESAVDVFLKMYTHARNKGLLKGLNDPEMDLKFEPDRDGANTIIQKALDEGRKQLSEFEGKSLLLKYDLPVLPYDIVNSAEAAAEAGDSMGWPVVMKIVSPEIAHKSDIGGVQLNIKDEKAARTAYSEIISNVKKNAPEAKIEGVLVEKMISKRYELLVGAKRDPIFGPLIIFGRGGITVEIEKDTHIGLPPLNRVGADLMIKNTRIYNQLKGFRNIPPVPLYRLENVLIKFSQLIMDFPQIQEVDINPLAADESGEAILDAHIVLN